MTEPAPTPTRSREGAPTATEADGRSDGARAGAMQEVPEPERTTSAYELLGGEAGVRSLVDRFYDRMAVDERFAELYALHPVPLDGSRDKLSWFLSGWLGGPDRYVERFGHPRLRARHLPYPIASRERDQWLLCMDKALAQTGASEELVAMLKMPLFRIADAIRNREGPSSATANPNIIAAG